MQTIADGKCFKKLDAFYGGFPQNCVLIEKF